MTSQTTSRCRSPKKNTKNRHSITLY